MDLRAENEDLRRRLADIEAALREAEELKTAAVESTQARLSAAEIELAQSEAALRDSEERLRRVLDGMGEGFGLLAPDFTVLEHNREALRMDGRARDEIVGRSHWDAFPGSEQTELGRRLKQAMAKRIPVVLEHRYAWEKDRALWLEMRAYPTADGGLAVFWRDVTDRVEAVEAVRESEARFAQFAASTTDVLWIRDADTKRLEYINPAFESVFGVTTGSVKGGIEPGAALVDPADRERVMEHLDAATRGEPQIYEFRIVHGSDGGERWIRDHCFPLIDETGRVERIGGIARDVTALKLAEQALRASEARFQQFANASAAGMWIRDAATLVMEYVSPSVSRIYGVEPEVVLDGVQHWAGLIVPEDRDVALAHLEEARRGKAVVHEFRIQRPDCGTFRWIRNTDFPLFDDQGRVQRIGGLAEDVTEAKLLTEHQGVLLSELQHRVRNIMAIIRSIAARSGERAGSVVEYAEVMAGRLLALSRVQSLLTRAANVNVSLRTIVMDEVSVQAHHEGQYEIDGPDIDISPKAAEVLTLAIHELSTNALKYGALSVPDGKVTVRWTTSDKDGTPWLSLDWREEGAKDQRAPQSDKPRRKGFGSELIEGRIPYELEGRGSLAITPDGAQCHLEFPLKSGASVLETGAPKRATVFGGALDMTGEPDLGGRRVLVVEDDYYLATDAARALAGAGAEVLGPYATEAQAREELQQQRPDAVLLDINLGLGPTFKLAETLKDQSVPFVFVTGYDQDVVPAEFADVGRLEKPVQLRRVVSTIAELLAPTT